MLDSRRQRREVQRHQQDERVLRLVYHRGSTARMAGLACTPPGGYDAAIGLDLIGSWTAGWEAADRELRNEE